MAPGRDRFEDGMENERFAWLYEDEPEDRTELAPLIELPDGDAGPARAAAELRALLAATASLARLDERVAGSDPDLRAGLTARLLLEEAAASARLDGYRTDAERLTLIVADAATGPLDVHEARGLLVYQLLAAAQRRDPRHLFTPRRVMAMARLRRSARGATPTQGWPAWADLFIPQHAEIAAVLARTLAPPRRAAWQALDPLTAAAEILRAWDGDGAGALLGGVPGRVLAGGWIARAGLVRWPLPPVALGFLGAAGDWRPWASDWPTVLFNRLEAGAQRALVLHARLAAFDRRLRAWAPARRRAHLEAVRACLLRQPLVGARMLARAAGITPQSANGLLRRLEDEGVLRKVTGRDSFRLYAGAWG